MKFSRPVNLMLYCGYMSRKKFYLKKLSQRGDIVIWQVDGNCIRRELDEEFTNFGQHYRFSYIPVNEFWLDKEAMPNERGFFIDHLLVEWKLMREGKTYHYALRQADQKEQSERTKAGDLAKVRRVNGQLDVNKIHIRPLGQIGELSVWLVRGRLTRSILNVDFTEGGHDLVYKFVPANEIWIDDDVMSAERPLVMLHELYERGQMALGLTYEQAHAKASELEWRCRHDEKKLVKNLAALRCKL